MFKSGGKSVALVKAKDDMRTELACAGHDWELDKAYNVAVRVEGGNITGYIAGKKVLDAQDSEYTGGGNGAVLVDGSAAIDQFDIAPFSVHTP